MRISIVVHSCLLNAGLINTLFGDLGIVINFDILIPNLAPDLPVRI